VRALLLHAVWRWFQRDTVQVCTCGSVTATQPAGPASEASHRGCELLIANVATSLFPMKLRTAVAIALVVVVVSRPAQLLTESVCAWLRRAAMAAHTAGLGVIVSTKLHYTLDVVLAWLLSSWVWNACNACLPACLPRPPSRRRCVPPCPHFELKAVPSLR
jgi:hypothetical protein